jgi:hypothetical protein
LGFIYLNFLIEYIVLHTLLSHITVPELKVLNLENKNAAIKIFKHMIAFLIRSQLVQTLNPETFYLVETLNPETFYLVDFLTF